MRPLRFILNDELVELDRVDPTHTVLDWLREDAELRGTKEGCAEGDCGACSVVVGRLQADGHLEYRAVNACILFMPVLDGAHIITVEHLKSPEGQLHPVQQAMVDYHGSQCGFCTPGIVMSLYALYLNQRERPSRDQIAEVLSGNLCRCTGYRPIIDAGVAMYDYEYNDPVLAAIGDTTKRLQALADDSEGLAIEADGRHYYAPTSKAELDKLVSEHPKANILAGGTDVGLWVTKLHLELDTLIYIGNVKDLYGISEDDENITVGAAETWTSVMGHLVDNYPSMGEFMNRFASTLVRNSATIGGNIANGSPIGDSMPALIALGTQVRLRSSRGSRDIALEDLYLDYKKQSREADEYVETIIIPKLKANEQFRSYKLSKRHDQDISGVCAAFKITLDGDQVVDFRSGFGGMGPTPARALKAEAAVKGQAWTKATAEAGAQAVDQDFNPMTDMRASDDYRRRAAGNLLRKFFVETQQAGAKTRVFAKQEVEA